MMHKAGGALIDDSNWQKSKLLCAVPGLAIVLALAFASAGYSQTGSGANGGMGSMHPPFTGRQDVDPLASGDYDPVMMERRIRVLNMERQKEMVADAAKLLKLARELNSEVAAQHSTTLTQEQLHKIAEIEKLARSVKERMVVGVGAPQSFLPTPSVVYPLR